MEMIQGWRTWWRQWSTWLTTIGAAIVAASPDLAQAWQQLPPEIQAAMPATWIKYMGVLIVVSSIPAKLVRQQKLYDHVNGELGATEPVAPVVKRRGRPRKPEGA